MSSPTRGYFNSQIEAIATFKSNVPITSRAKNSIWTPHAVTCYNSIQDMKARLSWLSSMSWQKSAHVSAVYFGTLSAPLVTIAGLGFLGKKYPDVVVPLINTAADFVANTFISPLKDGFYLLWDAYPGRTTAGTLVTAATASVLVAQDLRSKNSLIKGTCKAATFALIYSWIQFAKKQSDMVEARYTTTELNNRSSLDKSKALAFEELQTTFDNIARDLSAMSEYASDTNSAQAAYELKQTVESIIKNLPLISKAIENHFSFSASEASKILLELSKTALHISNSSFSLKNSDSNENHKFNAELISLIPVEQETCLPESVLEDLKTAKFHQTGFVNKFVKYAASLTSGCALTALIPSVAALFTHVNSNSETINQTAFRFAETVKTTTGNALNSTGEFFQNALDSFSSNGFIVTAQSMFSNTTQTLSNKASDLYSNVNFEELSKTAQTSASKIYQSGLSYTTTCAAEEIVNATWSDKLYACTIKQLPSTQDLSTNENLKNTLLGASALIAGITVSIFVCNRFNQEHIKNEKIFDEKQQSAKTSILNLYNGIGHYLAVENAEIGESNIPRKKALINLVLSLTKKLPEIKKTIDRSGIQNLTGEEATKELQTALKDIVTMNQYKNN